MIFDLFLTLFLVFLNGFFVAAEFAIVKVRLSQIELQVQAGHPMAKRTRHIIQHMDGYLAATQLGITFASLGLGWIGEDIVTRIILHAMTAFGITGHTQMAHDISLPIAFVFITVLHIVFGELAPKSVAIQRAEATSLIVALPLEIFYFIFRPFIWLLNGFANVVLKMVGIRPVHGSEIHTSDELKHLIDQGKTAGTIGITGYDIIKNAFDFSEKSVREIMIPRPRVLAVDIKKFNEDVLQSLIEEGYSRIPCFDGDLDDTVGLLYLKEVIAKTRKQQGHIDIRKILRPVIFVPETKKLGSLLKEFQKKHIHLAMVADEFGSITGIVTLEDILEELIGEIQDESDTEASIVVKHDSTYTVIATAPINDINFYLPHPITPHKHSETLAGALSERFGRIPTSDEKIVFDDYEFTILASLPNSISLVQIRDLSEAENPG